MGSVLKMSMDSVSRTRDVYVDMYRTMDTSRVQQSMNILATNSYVMETNIFRHPFEA